MGNKIDILEILLNPQDFTFVKLHIQDVTCPKNCLRQSLHSQLCDSVPCLLFLTSVCLFYDAANSYIVQRPFSQ
jgi:hypothetical protein